MMQRKATPFFRDNKKSELISGKTNPDPPKSFITDSPQANHLSAFRYGWLIGVMIMGLKMLDACMPCINATT
jgi:hypothetical protein